MMSACIAVVDDELPVLEMLRDLLEGGGFDVVAFDHPDSVTELDSRVRPALFIIDLMLPGSTGIELAERLRIAGFADTPMIAMSASKAMTQMASRSGLFQDTLYKPFDLSVLLDCVERHVA